MLNELYDRIAVLKVFQTTTLPNPDGSLKLQTIDPLGMAFPSKTADGSPAFRIKFKVDKMIEVTPNPTSIMIYNLGAKSRALFEHLNNMIVLEAGYGNNPKQIFKGSVSRCRTTKEGPDYITHIEAADGLFAYQNSQIDLAFGPGMQKSLAVTTLMGAIQKSGQISIGAVQGLPLDGYSSGIVLSGNAVDKLKAICDGANLNFYIEDEKIYILPVGMPRIKPPILISAETGLIGIPERRDVGMSAKILMNPDVGVFNPVIVKSIFVNGIFTTVKVTHEGDTHATPWYTNIETTYPGDKAKP